MGDDFEAFWKEYPKRPKNQNKPGAKLSFERRVKQGADPQKIIAAAKVYARKRDWVPDIGFYRNSSDSLIPMAQTWLNQKRYDDPDYQANPTPTMDDAEVERLMARYKERVAKNG